MWKRQHVAGEEHEMSKFSLTNLSQTISERWILHEIILPKFSQNSFRGSSVQSSSVLISRWQGSSTMTQVFEIVEMTHHLTDTRRWVSLFCFQSVIVYERILILSYFINSIRSDEVQRRSSRHMRFWARRGRLQKQVKCTTRSFLAHTQRCRLYLLFYIQPNELLCISGPRSRCGDEPWGHRLFAKKWAGLWKVDKQGSTFCWCIFISSM